MFGRKKIAALEDKIRKLLPGAMMLVEVNDQLKEEKQHLEIALRDTEQANERLKSRLKDAERVVIKPPIEWISGEPKDTGWYFVAIKPFNPLADIQTTALFYNPAARCRWMRGEKGNAERFEREIIAYMEVPNYEK